MLTTVTFDPDAWPANWILDMIARNGDCSEFYASGIWKRKRRKVRKDQHDKCWCHLHPDKFPHLAGSRPELVDADTVHHIHPVRIRPDIALSDLDEDGNQNLVCLCPSCHWHLHHRAQAPKIPERW